MMWWWHGASGWDWWWMSLMMVVFWGFIAFVAYAVVRGARHEHQHQTPEEILAQRFARGEITRDEYEDSRKLLVS